MLQIEAHRQFVLGDLGLVAAMGLAMMAVAIVEFRKTE